MLRKIINLLIVACLVVFVFIEGIYLGPYYASTRAGFGKLDRGISDNLA
jgi:hypothetical protein